MGARVNSAYLEAKVGLPFTLVLPAMRVPLASPVRLGFHDSHESEFAL